MAVLFLLRVAFYIKAEPIKMEEWIEDKDIGYASKDDGVRPRRIHRPNTTADE